jgi:hypothetical protein
LLLAFHSSFVSGFDCIEGKVRQDGISKIKVVNYCFDDFTKKILSYKTVKEKKLLYNSNKLIIIKAGEFKDALGSRGALVCNKTKGKFQEIEYWNNVGWVNNQICFYDDESFVDIDSLLLQIKYE